MDESPTLQSNRSYTELDRIYIQAKLYRDTWWKCDMDCFDKQLMKVVGMAGGILVAFGVAMISTAPLSDPTVEQVPLSRDAAYTGSLTLAGLAIFGSRVGLAHRLQH